jgi:hypothetical protein
MSMKILLGALIFLAACQSKKEEENLIVGKWEYEGIERYDSVPVDLQDSALNALHQQQKGLTFYLSKDKTFKVTQLKSDNTEQFVAEQPYELPEDMKFLILKNTGRPDDKFPIISLSDSIMKMNVFNSPFAYVVFRKKGS